MATNKAKVASALLGQGSGGGQLEKLTITYEKSKGRKASVEALFNPTEISLSRSVNWEQKKAASPGGNGIGLEQEQGFQSVEAETLSIELFFDTYEPRSTDMTLQRAVASRATDVRRHTDEIAMLAEVNIELHRPPRCMLAWGTFDIFEGVLVSLDQRFTLFLADGTPVRATLTCSFVEFDTTAHSRERELHSADVAKTRQVRRNDTLHSLAGEEYNDPSLWRHIAKANGIVNPRELQPGMILTIPKLRP